MMPMIPTDSTTPEVKADRRLSGGARGLLNDLVELNRKTSMEMARGVAESYLDRDGAIALADKLGVEAPRIKRRFQRFFTSTSVMTINIDAYDDEEADREAARMVDINAAHGDVHFGNRGRFDSGSGPRVVYSNPSATRPTVATVPDAHRWALEASEALLADRMVPSHMGDISWESVVGRQ